MIDSSGLRAVFFDAYGTLVSLDRFYERMQQQLRDRGVVLPIEVIAQSCQEEMRYYAERSWMAGDEQKLRDLRWECAGILQAALQRRDQRFFFTQKDTRDMLMSSLKFAAYEDVAPTLEALSRKNLQLAVVSNWDCGLPTLLEELSLAKYFKAITVSAMCGYSKPAAEIFRIASQAVGVSPEQIVHVGDKWDLDVEGPLGAGINAIYLMRNDDEPPSREVPTIRKLTDLVIDTWQIKHAEEQKEVVVSEHRHLD